MPQLEAMTVEARAAKAGDRYQGVYPIVLVDRKDKYTYITYETGGPVGSKKLRVEHTEKINIKREVLTEEEKAEQAAHFEAERKRYLVKQVRDNIEKAQASRKGSLAKLAEMAEGDYLPSYSDFDRALDATQHAGFWMAVQHGITSREDGSLHVHPEGVECKYSDEGKTYYSSDRKCLSDRVTWSDEYTIILESLRSTAETAQATIFRSASGSTSSNEMSNLYDRAKVAAAFKFLGELRWMSVADGELDVPKWVH